MNVCRASDEMGSDFTAERAEPEKTGQCNSDPEDSAYASGHRDGYADARSDKTVDPVTTHDGEAEAYDADLAYRAGWEAAMRQENVPEERQVEPPGRALPNKYAPRDWYQCEGLAMPGTQFDTYEEAREAGLKFIRTRMDDSHYPGSFQVRKYTSLSRIA